MAAYAPWPWFAEDLQPVLVPQFGEWVSIRVHISSPRDSICASGAGVNGWEGRQGADHEWGRECTNGTARGTAEHTSGAGRLCRSLVEDDPNPPNVVEYVGVGNVTVQG